MIGVGEHINDYSCASCLNGLEKDDKFISALNQHWHLDCFRCAACDTELSKLAWYFEKDGLLYCKEDYFSKFAELCQECKEIISGPTMTAGDHKFHPECFYCSCCKNHIGHGESYALVERSKLYCGQCYVREMENLTVKYPSTQLQSVSSSSATSPLSIPAKKKPPHSIRLVDIPWSENNKRGIRLSVDEVDFAPFSPTECRSVRISELDSNLELSALHVGDRVIEVNGHSVKENTLEDIEKIIQETDKVLQLTIEHDPGVDEPDFLSSIPTSRVPSTHTIPIAKQPINENKNQLSKADKERIQQRRDEGYMSGTSKTRQLLRKVNRNVNCNNSTNSLREKERSSSMSKLLDERSSQHLGELYDLSRTKSFRVEPKQTQQRIFRASDLVQGELLGKGFFGQVFKVTHKETKEVMVLKELYRVDEEAQKNFLKEVAVLRSLSHQNVLRFIGVLYKDKKLHLITEYIPGGSLKELIHDSGLPLCWEQRISFARDISAGMTYLHLKNIIHRDLNSLNCLVREDRTVIVADFGLARIVNNQPFLSLTKTDKWPQNGTGSGGRRGRQRRKRYTIVGNPWWMAPEMLNGKKYDEKVDVFSFGVIVCEIIGRVQADPDYLPRTSDFGLNQQVFKDKFCQSSCPEPFYKIAFLCCELNPDKRPPFEVLENWLETLTNFTRLRVPFPPDILFDIENYKGNQSCDSSLCHTPDALQTDEDELDEVFSSKKSEKSKKPRESETILDEPCRNKPVEFKIGDENQENLMPFIPKSPHLGKDFSPNGERIRDSLRARRKQKILQNRENQRKSLEASVENQLQKCSEILSKKIEDKPYNNTEGYVIKLNNNGLISVNSVNDLDSCSDFDSSCDTSLNYHEINNLPLPESPLVVNHPEIPIKLANNVEASYDIAPDIPIKINKLQENQISVTYSPKNPFKIMENEKNLKIFSSNPTERDVLVKILENPVEQRNPFKNETYGEKNPFKTQNPFQNEASYISNPFDSAQAHAKSSKVGNCVNKSTNPFLSEGATDPRKSAETDLEQKSVNDLVKSFEKQLNSSKLPPTEEPPKVIKDRPPSGLPPKVPAQLDSSSKLNYKNTLEDLKTKLNICKSKLGHPAQLGAPNASPQTVKRSMFSRINPLLSPKVFRRQQQDDVKNKNQMPTENAAGSSKKCYRINETPIFERKNIRNMFNFRRSDSDESIPVKNVRYHHQQQQNQDRRSPTTSSSGHSSPEKDKLFNFKPRISPTTDLKPNYSFESRNDREFSSSASTIENEEKSKKSSPANSTNYKLNKSQKVVFPMSRTPTPTSTKTTIVPIMSPATVHNLNAKLQEQRRLNQVNNNNNSIGKKPLERKVSPSSQKYLYKSSNNNNISNSNNVPTKAIRSQWNNSSPSTTTAPSTSTTKSGSKDKPMKNGGKNCVIESTAL